MAISESYLMDCMDYMETIPDKWFDLAVCDVPYGIGVGNMAYLSEMSTTVKQKNGRRLNGNKRKKAYKIKDWDNEPPPQQYFDELRRVSKEQIIFGVEYVNWDGLGTGRIKWVKGVPDGVSFKGYEMAYCSWIDFEVELPLLWAGMCQAKSLNEPMTQQGNKQLNEQRIHPCHKPVLLYSALYKNYLPQGGRVIDTHLGGGSNRIAADKAGNIDFYSTEIDSEYFNDAEKRWRDYKAQAVIDFPETIETKQIELF